MKSIFYSTIIFLFAAFTTSANAQTWTPKANFTGVSVQGATGFSIGSYAYMVTGGDSLANYNQFWQFEPATNIWTQKTNFPGTPRSYASCFVIGNCAYVGLGAGMTYNDGCYSDFWKYDPSTNVWTPVAPMPGNARSCASAFSIGNNGYVVCGLSILGIEQDVWSYNATMDSWVQKMDFPGTPRYIGTAFSIGSYGYFGTGWSMTSPLNDFMKYDPALDSWTPIANFPGLPRGNDVSFAMLGQGFVGAGEGNCTWLDDFFSYNPTLDIWTQIDSMTAPRIGAVGIAVGESGYVISGRLQNGSYTNGTFEYGNGTTTGVPSLADNSSNGISIYPNPVVDNATLALPEDGFYDVKIYDANGKLVRNLIGSGYIEFDKGELTSGIYICVITRTDLQTTGSTILMIVQ